MRVSKSAVAIGGLVLLLVLAGCGSQPPDDDPTITEPPVREPATNSSTTVQTATPIAPSTANTEKQQEFLEQIEAIRPDRRVPVKSVETRNGTLYVRFQTIREGALLDTQYLQLVDQYTDLVNQTWASNETWAAVRLEMTAVDQNGSNLGRARFVSYWGRQYETDELDTSQFNSRLRATTENATSDGSFEEPGGTVQSFGDAATADVDATALSVDQRGDTVFVTVRTDAANETQREQVVRDVARKYGEFVNNGWSTTALELTVRDRDGDLYGWYRVSFTDAALLAEGNDGVAETVLDSFYPENDHLEP